MRFTTNLAGVAVSLIALAGAPAFAQCVPGATDCYYDQATNTTYYDPSILHVSGPGATGQDPVLLKSATNFTVTNNSGGSPNTINPPITLYFVQATATAPTISAANLVGGPSLGVITINHLADFTGTASTDFYKDYLKLKGVNGSESIGNFDTGLALAGITPSNITDFSVYSAVIPTGLADKDILNIVGSFADGTYIVPLGVNIEDKGKDGTKVTYFDAPFTETGLIDAPPSDAPEPATVALLGVGLAGLGLVRLRRRH